LGNVAAFVYEAAKGLTWRVVESTAEVSQPRPAAGQWSRRGGMTRWPSYAWLRPLIWVR
jgi:hypothetical protein